MSSVSASRAKRDQKPESVAARRQLQVLIVADDPDVRANLADLVSSQADLSVLGEADSKGKALDLMRATKPDLLILDVHLPKTNGLELIKQVKAERPRLPMLVISDQDEGLYAERTLRAGARGYIMRTEPKETWLSAIHCVLNGDIYLSDRIMQRMLSSLVPRSASKEPSSPLDQLTDRELEVFQLLGSGYSTRQTAAHLNLSIKTVESYRENLKYKFNAKSGSELVQHAMLWTKVGTRV